MIKNKFILVGKDGRPSMRLVYSKMKSADSDLVIRRKLNNKEKLWVYSDNTVEQRNRLPINQLTFQGRTVIRWGNRINALTDDKTLVYNKGADIEKATDKALSRKLFISSGVNCPKLYTYEDYNNNKIVYPVIARPAFHAKGKNFIVLNNKEQFVEHFQIYRPLGWYYSEFIDKEREFRVHCGHGKVLAIMEKPKAEGIAWNRAINDEPFVRLKQSEYIHGVCLQALKAIDALGLDFGGVDVIYKNKKAYVLEVNTSPTLNSSEYVSNQYAKYFDWLMSTDKRRQHWDYTVYEKASSFAWKQNQLLNN